MLGALTAWNRPSTCSHLGQKLKDGERNEDAQAQRVASHQAAPHCGHHRLHRHADGPLTGCAVKHHANHTELKTPGFGQRGVTQGGNKPRVYHGAAVAEDVSDDRVVGEAVVRENGEEFLDDFRHLVCVVEQVLAG